MKKHRTRWRTLVPLLVFPISALSAHVIKVPEDQSTIQLAITAAEDGDTVLVDPGIYKENIIFRGKKIVVTSRFFVAGDSSIVASTIIDGSSPLQPDSGSVVRFVNHEDSTAILQGFTLRGGIGTKWTDEHGAGVYREGGGILVEGCSPTIRCNVIANNAVSVGGGVVSAGGGGIRAGDGNPHILNNLISGNTGRYGAGVVLNFCDAVIRNNIITENRGGEDYGGGALWINHPGATTKLIENNTIAGNVASGGGIYVWFGSPAAVRSCIIWGNTSPQVSVRTGTALTITYSDVQGLTSGTGNFSIDPGFSDASFHLSDTSKCIDAGDTSASALDPASLADPALALWPSMGTSRDDIGAYGGPGRAGFPPLSGATSVQNRPLRTVPEDFSLKQNFPNPFNPSTTIRYTLSRATHVTLSVYSLLGALVSTLVQAEQGAGEHEVHFDGGGLSSGVYFYRLSAGGQMQSKSLLLLK
ncbi:MAG TPA: T9SS type A sorting domain-containing protein [Bacteroidota bacterium]|nr:T9SS type A sorting domain-containing protein [Bacteroidota bacterium]